MSSQSKTTMAAFLTADLEPATRTLDGVRLVFHFCNFVNLTLGAVAFGVGIGYDLITINVSGDGSLKPVQTKFLVTGVFVILHGLIGTYGFMSKQSRSLILYGCLGLCLLVVGSLAAWTAVTNQKDIPEKSRDHFYTKYTNFTLRVNTSLGESNRSASLTYNNCHDTDTTKKRRQTSDRLGTDSDRHETDRPSRRHKRIPSNPYCDHSGSPDDGTTTSDDGENDFLVDDDKYIWDILYRRKYCRMPADIVERVDLEMKADNGTGNQTEISNNTGARNLTEILNKIEEDSEQYYRCKNATALISTDTNMQGYNCTIQTTPITCLRYIKILTENRVITMYVSLFLLSVTQSVCLICDILFIFWSLKEEADIQLHEAAVKNDCSDHRFSTKLQLLSRFLPCCFRLPSDYAAAPNIRNIPLCDISDTDELSPQSSPGSGDKV